MADKDAVAKDYMRNEVIFADAFNFKIYGGRQVVKPQLLRPLDTTSVALLYRDDGKSEVIQRYRDILKLATIMEDGEAVYLALGIENQTQMHYAMPVRMMVYDALFYDEQIRKIGERRQLEGRAYKTRAEFLSNFGADDKLPPIISITVYLGPERWTAPRSLHEMLAVRDKTTLQYVPDYRMNLLVPSEIAEEDFAKFKSELNLALKYIKHSGDDRELESFVWNNPEYRDVTRKTANFVNIMTDSELQFAEDKERVDMCEAIKGILERGRAEGRAEERAVGEERLMSILAEFVRDGIVTVSEAAKRAQMTESDFLARMNGAN